MSYQQWRDNFQNSELAAQAAFKEWQRTIELVEKISKELEFINEEMSNAEKD